MLKHRLQLLLNKILAVVPLGLLLGSDGGRGREFDVALGATLLLCLLLTWIEGAYLRRSTLRKMFILSVACVTLATAIYAFELMILSRLGELGGPIGHYGIAPVLAALYIGLLCCAVLCAWGDSKLSQTRKAD